MESNHSRMTSDDVQCTYALQCWKKENRLGPMPS